MPGAPSDSHHARTRKLADETRDLGRASPGHFPDILAYHTFPAFRSPVVLLIDQNSFRPLVNLAPVPGCESDFLAAFPKCPGSAPGSVALHPACRLSITSIRLPFVQAHLALARNLPFRLMRPLDKTITCILSNLNAIVRAEHT